MTVTNVVQPDAPPLVDLRVGDARADELKALAVRWPSWTLTRRQLCDLEL
ncbi:MAG: PUA-like domain, partial [Mycobacterium sp.]|nr:PUA-like domain [Mycobacterium sp.]